MKIQASPNDFFANTTIYVDEDKCPYFATSIIDDETGKYLELKDLIKN